MAEISSPDPIPVDVTSEFAVDAELVDPVEPVVDVAAGVVDEVVLEMFELI
jgi:hypothetical protein